MEMSTSVDSILDRPAMKPVASSAAGRFALRGLLATLVDQFERRAWPVVKPSRGKFCWI
jgi:hypothetical protein